MASKLRATPTTRSGWAVFFEKQFNRHQTADNAHLAMWYALLALAFGED